ncbi:hypothetical protein [Roseobacter sp. HKCCA0434]|uniref:hypothetical protein n=1 Tax=Roseobacter sp. HKCCA0434 TaxID=3079297 RepID=UPI0029059751|nr:hypothetical protein [Roseobacter sp. HKCCA0434]
MTFPLWRPTNGAVFNDQSNRPPANEYFVHMKDGSFKKAQKLYPWLDYDDHDRTMLRLPKSPHA